MNTPPPTEPETFTIRFQIEDTRPLTLYVLSFDTNQRNDKEAEYVEVFRWWTEDKETNE